MCASDTYDIFEALALGPLVHAKASTPYTRSPDREDMNPYLDHDDELAVKTGQVLEDPGIAPAYSEAEVQNWYVPTGEAPRLCIIPKYHEIFEPQSRFRTANLKVESNHKANKFKERKAHLLKEASSIISLPQNIPLRWNLRGFNITISDILSGKTFKRQTVIAHSERESKREFSNCERAEMLSISSTGSDTTIGNAQKTPPMDQNSFPLFIRGHATARNESNFILTPPTTPKRQDTFPRDGGSGHIKSSSSSSNEMVFENLFFPSPPRARNGRLTPPQSPPLLRRRENSPTRLQPRLAANARPQLSIPTKLAPTTGFITLSSTPFSLTSPLFRHGPIRVDRRQKCFSPEDKKLDWTAFHMAIIGVMDGREDEKDEVDCRIGEAELNDITQWFSDFGLGMGSMEKGNGRVD